MNHKEEREYDLVISQGTLVDGTGKSPYIGTVGIKNGKIAWVGKDDTLIGKRNIHARGLVVAPGFIDLHNHSDWHIQENPTALNYIHQGVTTIIGGNCGFLGMRETGTGAILDIAPFLETVQEGGVTPNFGVLAGYGTIRQERMKDSTADPTKEEASRIKETLVQSLADGAFGLSCGLEYLPGRFATTQELIEIGVLIKEHQGFLAIHLRDEQARILNSVAEAIEIGLKSKVPVQISHLKACGPKAWGLGPTISAMIGMAVAMGGDICADLYPYLSSSTGLSQLFPNWAHQGGKEELQKRLLDEDLVPMLKNYAYNQIHQRVGEDLSLIQFVSSQKRPHWAGRTLKELLQEAGWNGDLERGRDFLMDAFLMDDPAIIYHYLLEDDVQALILNPQVMVCSDGEICEPGKGHPHPRSYGSFPRFLRRYTQEEFLFSLEEAVRKMTQLPAKRLGIKDRGRIEGGFWADLVLFQPHAVLDKADFSNPHQYPEGIEYVLVNGEVVLEKGNFTGSRPGQVLYGPGSKG